VPIPSGFTVSLIAGCVGQCGTWEIPRPDRSLALRNVVSNRAAKIPAMPFGRQTDFARYVAITTPDCVAFASTKSSFA